MNLRPDERPSTISDGEAEGINWVRRVASASFRGIHLRGHLQSCSSDTFIETLTAAQKKEIPMLIRREARRRAFLLLKRQQFKAAWLEFRSARSQQILAVGYEPADTNKILVYVGRDAPGALRPQITGMYTMTNIHERWQITGGP